MANFILRRLVGIVPILVGITMVTFMIMHLTPGDPVRIMLGEQANTVDMEALRRELGLDRPLPVQYLNWMGRAVQGDLGRSIRTQRRVGEEIIMRLPATIELAFASITIAVIVGVFLGVLSAVRRRSWTDFFTRTLALASVSLPSFWLGIMLILGLSLKVDLFPASGRGEFLTTDGWLHLVLPSLTLAMLPMGIAMRMTRSCMLEVIQQDYIRTARSKGLSEWRVVYSHALKNALIPVVTVIGLSFGHLLGGAIVTETVFAWPGLGKLAVDSIKTRDLPTTQGIVLLMALIFVMVNLLVDLIYAVLDPRIRYD